MIPLESLVRNLSLMIHWLVLPINCFVPSANLTLQKNNYFHCWYTIEGISLIENWRFRSPQASETQHSSLLLLTRLLRKLIMTARKFTLNQTALQIYLRGLKMPARMF